jgi:uncharacterized protein (TIGR02246 family)
MDISQAFADLNSKFVETVNAHDAHRWAALFSKDAVLVPAGQPSVNGRDGIEEWGEVATKVWNHLEIQQGRCSADGKCRVGARYLDWEYQPARQADNGHQRKLLARS